MLGRKWHPATLTAVADPPVHPDAKVANARLAHDTSQAKVPLHRSREMSQVRISDGAAEAAACTWPSMSRSYLRSEAVRSLAQESKRHADEDDRVRQRAELRVRPRRDDDQRRDDHGADTNHPPPARPDEQRDGGGQEEQRRHEPQAAERAEMGWVSCGSSAQPKALAAPSRWISPWTTSRIAKAVSMRVRLRKRRDPRAPFGVTLERSQ